MAAQCINMKPHVFLSGEKGVGKSMIIRRLLDDYKGIVGGLFTIRTNEVYQDRYSVHLIKAGCDEKPTEENLLFLCGKPDDLEKPQRFNNLGCKTLEGCKGAGLVVMDELGPNEENAMEFCSAVITMLDGDVPVIGVLQKAESELLKAAACHPKVKLIEVTKDNRDAVLQSLRNILP